MPGDYSVLAPIYDEIGLSAFVEKMTPTIIDYAQRIDWLGRRIVILGCGTGKSISYLSHYPYNIIGVDNSNEMLEVARRSMDVQGLSLKFLQMDIREITNQISTADLVLALNVMNDMSSLRDLETIFSSANRILDAGKLFVFDMITVQGLTEKGLIDSEIIHDDPKRLTVFMTNSYDYERQLNNSQYVIFRHINGVWERSEARQVLRAFPIQAVASLLQRNGFSIRTIMNPDMDVYEPGVSNASRVIFFAEKPNT